MPEDLLWKKMIKNTRIQNTIVLTENKIATP